MKMKVNRPGIQINEVDALIFDLGGVILDVDFARTIEAFRTLKIDGLEVVDIIAEGETFFRDLELGLLSPEEFIAALRHARPAVGAISDKELWGAWNALLLPFDKQRVELLRELKKQGPVYVLSNTNLPHRIRFREQFFEQFGGDFEALFSGCFYSDELHLRKPDSAIYRRVAAAIGATPDKILFIDDNAANVAQARAEGWQGYHLTGGERITDLFEL